ncbi:Phthiocerol/phthiodiolone dimycocerosyl transferase C-terminus [Amycolatopsis tolypomycina]|uniref:Phthiocerol/phthiodiolone dimycocerosyl transferase n=1 Tax=Amycolatopsis tolypomycina TaxID=208445 RepID=A0A1H4UVZ2_9PSEU|nr:hypothetical protein [Amycolatopsis tolypomycina]SEC72896.1 Phthiocerol/phthiodiolone dimycocerosyl transferase C-terminus [Amycolatopsis tolypomycina]
MDLTGLERPLNYLELAHLDRVVIMAAEYEGELDAAVLARAFRHLCLAHPVLRGRIRGTSPEAVLAVSPEHEPELIVLPDGPDALARITGLPWDATAGVADLVLVQGDGHRYVALRTDHSITDANAWLGTFRELLRVFTALASGDEPVSEPGTALPAPPAALFHERLGLIPYDRRLFHSAVPPEPSGPAAGLFSGYLRLSAEETQWLKRAARRYETTVHGLVAGAILLAQRVLAGGREAVPMYCVSPVDFRRRVDPPVGELETTNFMMSYVAETGVSPRLSPVLVGREVKARMDEVLAGGEGVREAAPMADTLGRNLSYALISNLGVVAEFPAPPGLEFTELHILDTVGDTFFPGYYVSTYRDRLTVLHIFTDRFFTRGDVDRIVRELHEQLLIIGASA